MKYRHSFLCRYLLSLFVIAICFTPLTVLAMEHKNISASVRDIKFAPSENITDMIIEYVEGASEQVDVAVFIFNYMPLADVLIDAHKKGIKVRVLVDIRSSEKMQSDIGTYDISVIQYLKENGIDVKVYDATEYSNAIMHHKFIIIDKNILMLGSFNFQKAAQKYNNENFNVIQSTQFAREYTSEFNRLWNSEYVLSDVEIAEKIYSSRSDPRFGIIYDIIHAMKSQLLFILLVVSIAINTILLSKKRDDQTNV